MIEGARQTNQLFYLGFVAVAMGLGALLGTWSFSDQYFARGFDAALSKQSTISTSSHQTFDAAVDNVSTADAVGTIENANLELPISGGEEFWLGHTRFTGSAASPAAFSGPFKLGDQLVIGPNDGKRMWVVVNISQLTKQDNIVSEMTPSILLITLQDRTSGTKTGPLLRIIVDTNDSLIGSRRVSLLSVSTAIL